ncbi:NAD+ diphosphatase [Burkholderiales bacterium]|nr:NAD+ diphosphatase [Burkholderiales bacterium]
MIVTPADFISGIAPDPTATGAPLVLVLQASRVLVHADNGEPAPSSLAWTTFEPRAERHCLGRLGERNCWLLLAPPDATAPAGLIWQGMRTLFGVWPTALLAVLTRALEVAEWSRSHRYCGVCGSPTTDLPGERARHCPGCGHSAYPRLSPAVMVLVRRGDQVLLARGARFKAPIFSALAGFVEAGESLEDTLHREVREEVGIEVSDLEYFGSQSWPFPHSLMVAFRAQYAGGSLRPDGNEIIEAGWYSAGELPPLPSPASIARLLIDQALGLAPEA